MSNYANRLRCPIHGTVGHCDACLPLLAVRRARYAAHYLKALHAARINHDEGYWRMYQNAAAAHGRRAS